MLTTGVRAGAHKNDINCQKCDKCQAPVFVVLCLRSGQCTRYYGSRQKMVVFFLLLAPVKFCQRCMCEIIS